MPLSTAVFTSGRPFWCAFGSFPLLVHPRNSTLASVFLFTFLFFPLMIPIWNIPFEILYMYYEHIYSTLCTCIIYLNINTSPAKMVRMFDKIKYQVAFREEDSPMLVVVMVTNTLFHISSGNGN